MPEAKEFPASGSLSPRMRTGQRIGSIRPDLMPSALADFKELIKEKTGRLLGLGRRSPRQFSVALMKSVTAQPREGWIRASSAGSGAAASAELVD